jgi:RND family efflux transporter MFP subunit
MHYNVENETVKQIRKDKYTTMKKYSIFAVLIIFLASCGSPDKQAQINKLKVERDALNEQIASLEKELDTTLVIADNSTKIQLFELQTTEFRHFIEVQGKVDGEQNTEVTSQSPGVVTNIFIKEGDNVKKGQVLAELDYQVLKQSLEEVKGQLDFATNMYLKQKNLWEKNIGSEVQYLTAKNNKESLERRVATIKDQIILSKYISPINGTVELIPFKVGQMVSPGMPGSGIRVVNMSSVKVQADLAEAYAPLIKTGDAVKIGFPDIDKEIDAKVTFASRYIDPVNRTFKVETRLGANGTTYRANMIALLRINDYTNREALVVPINIIQRSMNEKYVMVVEVKDGKMYAAKRIIEYQNTYNSMAEVVSGLKEGDKIISVGYQNLKPGDVVSL